ncbi:MAG: deoxyribose-phosphate aldolase [Treponema sp.]|nr:deoxyribose-phosphate aldolase [Treponema sp.]
MSKKKFAAMIDQTLLRPDVTEAEVEVFCKQASELHFASVCINPLFVPLAHSILASSKVKVCTVVDFPLGAGGLTAKSYGATASIAVGADEVDIMIDLSLVKAHKWRQLRTQLNHIIKSVRKSSEHRIDAESREPAIAKLILETSALSDEEIVESCKCAKRVGFDFVKTSTGFGSGGATVHAVRLMRQTVGTDMGVKASGGIRSIKDALALIEAGASRIGTSSGEKLLESFVESEYPD